MYKKENCKDTNCYNPVKISSRENVLSQKGRGGWHVVERAYKRHEKRSLDKGTKELNCGIQKNSTSP